MGFNSGFKGLTGPYEYEHQALVLRHIAVPENLGVNGRGVRNYLDCPHLQQFCYL